MTERPITGDMLAAVSNEMARLKAHHYGRGPDEAKSYLNDEVLVCVMKGGLTALERTLVANGDVHLVRRVRQRFQDLMEPFFTGAVEQITGRTVLTYQSQVLVDPDYVVEIFVLGDSATHR